MTALFSPISRRVARQPGTRADRLAPALRGGWAALAVASLLALQAGCAPQDASEAAPTRATSSPEEEVARTRMSAPAAAAVADSVGGAPAMKAPERRRVAVTPEPSQAELASQGGATAPSQRLLAVSHHLSVQVAAPQLVDRWQQVRDACARLDCDLESATVRRESTSAAAGAALALRVAPRDVDALLAPLQAAGSGVNILNHQTTSEDKTAEMVDVQAHLKNRTDYRDGLRELLKDTSAKRDLSDLMEIRNMLSNTQAEIDSALTQQKLLERQTSKQRVDIDFQPAPQLTDARYSPIGHAWRQAGWAMQQTVAAMLTFGAYALPLVVAGGALVLSVVGFGRGVRRRQLAAKARARAAARG